MKKIEEIKVRQWLTRKDDNPVPMRIMTGEVVRETQKAMLVKLNGFLRPSGTCLHCGRRLTNPVSLLYGIGPICGEHFNINPLSSAEELHSIYEEMARLMGEVKWEGWIPKSQVESIEYGA
jgi:hypothetical protein